MRKGGLKVREGRMEARKGQKAVRKRGRGVKTTRKEKRLLLPPKRVTTIHLQSVSSEGVNCRVSDSNKGALKGSKYNLELLYVLSYV